MGGIASFFLEGDVWMMPIAAVSVVVLAVVVERAYALMVAYNTNAPKLYGQILDAIKRNQDADAIKVCDQAGKSALAHVLKNGISHAHAGEEAVATAIEEATLEVTPKVQKRVHALGGLSSLATLLGLLGTVMGLIEAFRVVAEAPADQKAVLLTKSIAVAMNTTAFGLMVAIPGTMAYLLLNGSMKKIIDDMEVYSAKLENTLRDRKNR